MPETVGRPSSYSDTAKNIAKRFIRHENAVLIVVLAVLIAAFSVITGGVTTTRVRGKGTRVRSDWKRVCTHC